MPASCHEERTTSILAAECGVSVAVIRKWKMRGDLPSAPIGRQGQGRGNECVWSDEAVSELKKRAAENRTTGFRKTRQTS